jgi:hypothetical protein
MKRVYLNLFSTPTTYVSSYLHSHLDLLETCTTQPNRQKLWIRFRMFDSPLGEPFYIEFKELFLGRISGNIS